MHLNDFYKAISQKWNCFSSSKIGLTMRFTAILMLAACLQVSATTSAQKVTISGENIPLKKVFKSIRDQTGYNFFYSNHTLKNTPSVSLDAHNSDLKDLLKNVFVNQPLLYSMDNGIIVVRRKNMPPLPVVLEEELPDKTITGVVTDSTTGEPLSGVTIKVKGENIGTVTDAEGKFSLEVDKNAVLMVSFLGYSSKSVSVGSNNNLNIFLVSAATGLNQLVVVGYGTQKKKNVTGAVSQINMSEASEQPLTSTSKFLQGKAPGLNINLSSGRPGTEGDLNVRGNTSITGTGKPLVLIDGIPGDMDNVSPSNIKSVSVLKDASAAAIYGSRAAFGVILVTTKNGVAGKPRLTFSTNLSWQTFQTKTDFITNALDYFSIADTSYKRALGRTLMGFTPEDLKELEKRKGDKTENPNRPWVVTKSPNNGRDVYKYYANFDWFRFFNNKWRPKQTYNLSFTGGNEKLKYYLSGNLTHEKGVYRVNPDHYNRKGFRIKVDYDIFPWLTVGTNTRFFTSKYEYNGKKGGGFPGKRSGTTQFEFFYPNMMPTNPDGTFVYGTENGVYNLHGVQAALLSKDVGGHEYKKHFRTTFDAKIHILDNLQLTANYSYIFDPGETLYRQIPLFSSLHPGEQTVIPQYKENQLEQTQFNSQENVVNLFLDYHVSLGDHFLKFVGGYNQHIYDYHSLYGKGYEMLGTSKNDFNLSIGRTQLTGGQNKWALRSLFYRANYNYKERYYLQFAGRYDGTSRFPKGDRFGFFPTLSVGWVTSEENFFKPLNKAIQFFKIRASYGTLGNQVVDPYIYIPGMAVTKMSYLNSNHQELESVSSPNPVSPTLTWEKVSTKNIGLDIGVLNNRLTLDLNGYIRDTKGMLTKGKTLPAVFGASEPKENAADLRVKGFELEIEWRDFVNINGSKLSYHVGGYLTDYVGHITKFDNPEELISDYYVGQKLGDIWGYIYDGFFKTDNEADNYDVDMTNVEKRRVQSHNAATRKLQAGDIKILDLNGDKVINKGANTVSNPGDQKIIGNSQPRWKFNFKFGGSFKGFSIDALFQGIGSQNYYPDDQNAMFWSVYARPYVSYIPLNFKDKMWSPDNPNAYFPRVFGYSAQNSELVQPNNMYLQNIGFLKLRNLTIGYKLPEELVKKMHLSEAQFYVNGYNLFTIAPGLHTKYLDPEEASQAGYGYPMGKSYSVGLKVSF